MTPRILIVMAKTGDGHSSTAYALQSAILKVLGERAQSAGSGSEQARCDVVDLLSLADHPVYRKLGPAYELYTQANPRAGWYNAAFTLTNTSLGAEMLAAHMSRACASSVKKVVEAYEPNVVISTHPLLNALITHARDAYGFTYRCACVVTDLLDFHATWADDDMDMYAAPIEQSMRSLVRQGVAPSKIHVTGLVVHSKFFAHQDARRTREQSREQLGIPISDFVVVVSGGGAGAGRMLQVTTALMQLDCVHVIVLAGRNEALRTRLLGGTRARAGNTLTTHGFVDNVQDFLSVCDVLICKAGPGTVMEAAIMRRPVIIMSAVGIMERPNVAYVVRHSLGCDATRMTAADVARLAAKFRRGERLREKAERVLEGLPAPRDSSVAVARLVLDKLCDAGGGSA